MCEGKVSSLLHLRLLSLPSLYPLGATGVHNVCFQQVQDDTSKARSVNNDWEFVSKGTEMSLGKFVPEYFTPLTNKHFFQQTLATKGRGMRRFQL
jgi:hypothetical protein